MSKTKAELQKELKILKVKHAGDMGLMQTKYEAAFQKLRSGVKQRDWRAELNISLARAYKIAHPDCKGAIRIMTAMIGGGND